MKSVEFCYWLQGLFELGAPVTLDEEQTELIKKHLNMVFFHEIDKSYPVNQQAALSAIHNTKVTGNNYTMNPYMQEHTIVISC